MAFKAEHLVILPVVFCGFDNLFQAVFHYYIESSVLM